MTLTCCQDHILTENIWFVGLKHHIVEIREDINRKTLPEFTFIQISPLLPLGQKLVQAGLPIPGSQVIENVSQKSIFQSQHDSMIVPS